MAIIEGFLSRYLKEYDFYSQAARICSLQSEKLLEDNGIRAMVTYRAKRVDRLKDKLKKRNEKKNYKTIDEIYADIVDLAGVRIALYFPSDRNEIDQLIKLKFSVKEVKIFPDNSEKKLDKVFDGYKATHYRVNLKEETLNNSDNRFSKALIEIQVASVLMHAWSEVEHDLVYKPTSGNLSEDEQSILDELNGLVLTGEISLENLQRAYKRRVEKEDKPFASHFELSAFIYDVLKIDYPHLRTEPFMGRVNLLYKFLQKSNLDKPDKVKKYISKVAPQEEKRPIAEQILDIILDENPRLYPVFEKIKLEDALKNPIKSVNVNENIEGGSTAMAEFLLEWVKFEKLIRSEVLKDRKTKNNILQVPMYKELERLKLLDNDELSEYNYLRTFRNNIVHGIISADSSTFTENISRIKAILKHFENKIHQDNKKNKGGEAEVD